MYSQNNNIKKYSNREKYKLRDKISTLDEEECYEILKIIKDNTDKITKNNYGFHINFKYLSDETIDKINFFLDFRKVSNIEIKDIELLKKKTLDLHQEYNQFDINNDFMPAIHNAPSINVNLDEIIDKEFETDQDLILNQPDDSDNGSHDNDDDDENIIGNQEEEYDNEDIKSTRDLNVKKKIEDVIDDVVMMNMMDKKKKNTFRNKMLRKCKDINRNNELSYYNSVIYNDVDDNGSIDEVDIDNHELTEDNW
jgi:hypothetical protein